MQRLFGTFARIVGLIHTSSAREMKSIQIRAVLFQEGDAWCAQCLEHDIAAEARSLSELKAELETVLSIQVEMAIERGQEPFASLPPAPAKYFRMFEQFERANGVEEDRPISLSASVAGCVMARFAYSQPALT